MTRGIIEVLAALLIYGGHALGAMIGVVLAVLDAVAQLLFLASFPVWSAITIGIDVLTIYALVAHGTVPRRLRA